MPSGSRMRFSKKKFLRTNIWLIMRFLDEKELLMKTLISKIVRGERRPLQKPKVSESNKKMQF